MPRFKYKILVFFLFAGLLAGAMAGGFFSLIHDLPEINTLKQFRPSSVTTVYSTDHQIITRLYLEKRFPVEIDQIPDHLIQALLITEDRAFYTHAGVNFKAIVRAIIQDIKAGGFVQGASTLTQQLSKTLFLSPEKSIVRKIREALLALQIERRYTKDEILALYLNQIYLGSGSYGVEAAARTYFDTSVSGLTLGQAALIAGLPKAPSVYSPKENPDHARRRRQVVLRQMLDLSAITQDQFDLASQEPVYIAPEEPPRDQAPYFTDYLKTQLGSIPDLDLTAGLNIYTTLNLRLQKAAQTAVATHLADLEARMGKNNMPSPSPQAALIALDVATGAVRSMVGGAGYEASQFNRAIQAKRQPGSAFKPLVYATALEKGWEQDQILADAPLTYRISNTRTWTVNNFSRTYKGDITLRKALALSLNTPVVRLAEELTVQAVIEMAQKTGIKSALPPYLSIALGSAEVSLLELTSAYTPFANRGVRAQPHCIDRITDRNGRDVYKNKIIRQPVTDRTTAALVTDMLKGVMLEGTGRRAQGLHREIAGKTGTTDKYKDALFVGFSPHLACGVWVGNDDATSLGPYETGAKSALPMWTDYMAAALKDAPLQYFDIPDTTQVVYMLPDSGKLVPARTPGSVRILKRRP